MLIPIKKKNKDFSEISLHGFLLLRFHTAAGNTKKNVFLALFCKLGHYFYIALKFLGRRSDLGANTQNGISECRRAASHTESQRCSQ